MKSADVAWSTFVPATTRSFTFVDYDAARLEQSLPPEIDIDPPSNRSDSPHSRAALAQLRDIAAALGDAPWLVDGSRMRAHLPPYGSKSARWVLSLFGPAFPQAEVVTLRPDGVIVATSELDVERHQSVAVVTRRGELPPAVGQQPPEGLRTVVRAFKAAGIVSGRARLRDPGDRGVATGVRNIRAQSTEWLILWVRPDLDVDVLADTARRAIADSGCAAVLDLSSASLAVDEGVAAFTLTGLHGASAIPPVREQLMGYLDPLIRYGFPFPAKR